MIAHDGGALLNLKQLLMVSGGVNLTGGFSLSPDDLPGSGELQIFLLDRFAVTIPELFRQSKVSQIFHQCLCLKLFWKKWICDLYKCVSSRES